jgi:hypothetical protein
MPKANPLLSAGARLERSSFRIYLKNKITNGSDVLRERETLEAVLRWVRGRQKRYDKRPGGLGK